MFTHIETVAGPANIVVRTIDTDCLIIAIGSKSTLDESVHVWLEVGQQLNNTLILVLISFAIVWDVYFLLESSRIILSLGVTTPLLPTGKERSDLSNY